MSSRESVKPRGRIGAQRTRSDFKPRIEPLEARVLLKSELIYNGDFELGDRGFVTDYEYLGHILELGSYAITTDPRLVHRDAASYGDHTTGSGQMLAANGSDRADVVVWSQDVAVDPETRYVFSIWASSWVSLSPARLEVLFNDTSIGLFTAPVSAGVWEQFTTFWESGDSTVVTIKVIDRNLQFSGNDFALDDISLRREDGCRRSLPPSPTLGPSAIALLAPLPGGLCWQPATRPEGGPPRPPVDRAPVAAEAFDQFWFEPPPPDGALPAGGNRVASRYGRSAPDRGSGDITDGFWEQYRA